MLSLRELEHVYAEWLQNRSAHEDEYQMLDWSAREYCVAISLMLIGVRVILPPDELRHLPINYKVDTTLTTAQKRAITLMWKRLYDAESN